MFYMIGYKFGGVFFVFFGLLFYVDGFDLVLWMLKEIGVCMVLGDVFGEEFINVVCISFLMICEKLE